jgi:amino acid adenylation domain-containing protein/thioester reductase-like protein
MIFAGDGALLQQAVSSALNKAYRIDRVFGNTDRTAAFCRQRGVPFELADGLNEDPERVRSICTDGIGFSIDNALILKPRLLDSAGVSFFSVHSGIIPFQRGNPVVATIFAILQGSKEYGVSLFKLNAEIDAGEILAIKRFAIMPRSRLHEIVVVSALLCQSIFEEYLDRIVHGAYTSERVSMGDTRPYSLKDLGKLEEYRDHADFDRATDFGILDGLLPKDQLVLIAALRERRLRDAPTIPPASAARERQFSYWKRRLADLPSLRLPTRRAPPAISGDRARFSFTLREQATEPLKALARAQSAPEHAVLLAVFYALLARYTGLHDLCVGSAIRRPDQNPIGAPAGAFSNVVALRANVSGQPTCAQLVSHVRQICAEAGEHADLPFEEVLRALRPQARGRLFDVSFQSHRGAIPETAPATSSVDQAWTLCESGGRFEGLIEYDSGLFDETTVVRLATHYEYLLGEMLAHPDASIFTLELVTPAERQTILREWNATRADYVRNRCVHELVEEQAAKTPGAVAAIGPDGERLSYGEVNARANQLARYLVTQGVKPETRVGICLKRGVDMIIGILGILKAGGAFVPFDPAYPEERIAFMLKDADVSLLLTERLFAGHLPAGGWRCAVLDDAALSSVLQCLPSADLSLEAATSSHLAYVIYTSGSTGRPRGVMVEHGSVHNTFAATQWAHPMGPNERFLSLASFGSDTAVWQLLAPLCWGACVVLNTQVADPSEILRCIDQHEVTTVELVPSLLRTVLEEVDRGARSARSLRTLISSGEALTSSLLEHASASLPHCAVFNQYGPTETSSQVTYHRCHLGKPVSIGVPLAHTRIYILSAEGKTVPVGVIGEIVIGGAGLARGYLNRPELTDEKFVRDPFSAEPGARMYKTGDLGRFLENGEIEFLGRLDQQVKIRGHRVELGEIENVLRQFPTVSDAVVLIADEQSVNPRLIGYVVAGASGDGSRSSRVFVDRLREHVRRQVPAHMVPAVIIPLQQWPLTPHGKVDRKALPNPSTGQGLIGSERVAPRNEVERAIAKIWATVLGVDSVGVHDHFLELGGHSLLAIRLIAEVRAAFEVELSLGSVFEMPTVELMAAFVASGRTKKLRSQQQPTRETLLRDAILPPEIIATQATTRPTGSDVLLTGATGFLGRHLLRALLERTSMRIHCLVRGSSRDPASRRIRAALELAGANVDSANRVNVIVGDLTLPGLGLSSDVWSLLAEEVGAIYHLGAMVNHVTSYALLLDANVKGTLEVLRLASTGRIKAVHFVSSVDVVGACAGTSSTNEVLLCSEPPLGVEAYTSSKWVADQLVAKADARGVPVCIYRTGYIGPHSTSGDANAAGWFELYLRTVLKLRSIPADARDFALTPVDLIVDSIFELSRQPASLHHAFHLLHRQLTSTSATIVEAARRLGHVLEVVPRGAWRERLATYCAAHPDDPAVVLGPYLDAVSEHGPGHASTRAPIDFTRAAAACAPMRAFEPEMLLPAFLRRASPEAAGLPPRVRGLLA